MECILAIAIAVATLEVIAVKARVSSVASCSNQSSSIPSTHRVTHQLPENFEIARSSVSHKNSTITTAEIDDDCSY